MLKCGPPAGGPANPTEHRLSNWFKSSASTRSRANAKTHHYPAKWDNDAFVSSAKQAQIVLASIKRNTQTFRKLRGGTLGNIPPPR